MSDELDEIYIGCVSTTVPPNVPSQVRQCYQCGSDVWLSDKMLSLIAREHGDAQINVYCTFTCGVPVDEPTTIHPEQREWLRTEHGLTDAEIDATIDVANEIRRKP